ncbi:hypothetical protein SAMN05216409_1285 [Pseudomonas lutea]|uniref:Uncharacterized protein n=1 Tax=Pseudomonas lutea TaxID=243924 RepID=A0A9X8QM22_9PSED|nr:hypothetical protein SAMN05216409_1285 [Pseudomonas lutea]
MQHVKNTRQAAEAYAWLQQGRTVRIRAINCRDLVRHAQALARVEQYAKLGRAA